MKVFAEQPREHRVCLKVKTLSFSFFLQICTTFIGSKDFCDSYIFEKVDGKMENVNNNKMNVTHFKIQNSVLPSDK